MEQIVVENPECEICGNRCELGGDWAFPARRCPRCGSFDYDGTVPWRRPANPDEMVRLSGWVREQNDAGVECARITPEIARRVMSMPRPGLYERALRGLAYIATKAHHLARVSFNADTFTDDLEFSARTYSKDKEEAHTLFAVLRDKGFFKDLPLEQYALSVDGLLQAEALGAPQSGSPSAFVAMWFDPTMDDVWTNGFHPGITAAGYRPVRIDAEEYVGGITDQILAEIRRARFVLADYTGQRQGVYFEAGFAEGLRLTVFPTCRKDDVENLHFDIRHVNTITWAAPAELADRLEKRIRAVIGAGPDASPEPGF